MLFAGLLALGAVALAQFGVHLWEMASESPVLGGEVETITYAPALIPEPEPEPIPEPPPTPEEKP